jgi:hypothetical protein
MKVGRSFCSFDVPEHDAEDAIARAIDVFEALIEANTLEER